jgi:ribosomal 30S subunit maturation factor RimM
MTMRTVVAGKVHSVNPGKRQVRIQPAGKDVPDEAFLGRLRLRLTDGRELRSLVAALRRPHGMVVVELTPGTPRDSVAAMRGAEVLWETDEAAVALLERREVDALIGMRLVGPDEAEIGEVVGALETPAHGVVEVRQPDGRNLLLPVIPEAVKRIEWESGAIFVGDIAPYAVDDAD